MPLGDDRVVERPALGRDGRHGDDLVARSQDPAQRLAPPDERLVEQRSTVEVRAGRRRGTRPAAPARRPAALASAAGPPGRRRRPRPARRRGSPSAPRRRTAMPASSGSAAGRSTPVGVDDPDLAVTRPRRAGPMHDQRPHAAPPRLEQVLVGIERLGQRARQHRPQVRAGPAGGRSRAAARAGRPSWPDGSPLELGTSPVVRPDLPGGRRAPTAPPRRPVPPARRHRAAPVARRPVVGRHAPDGRARLRRLPARRSGSSRPTAAAPPRQLTLGAGTTATPASRPMAGRSRSSRTGGRSSRRSRRGRATPRSARTRSQVHLLPLDGGEARRLTDLPRGVTRFEWSPDGARLVVVELVPTARRARTRTAAAAASTAAPKPGTPPPSDYRFIDRLDYMLNGAGFTYDRIDHLWLVDVATGAATPPDGRPGRRRRAGLVARRHADRVLLEPPARPDLVLRSGIHVVDVDDAAGDGDHGAGRGRSSGPGLDAGRPVDRGTRRPARGRAASRNDMWLFAADGSDATPTGGRNLSGRHDLMPVSGMNSDVTRGRGDPSLGRRPTVVAHVQRADRGLVRAVADRDRRRRRRAADRGPPLRLAAGTRSPGRVAGARIAYLRSTPTETPDVWLPRRRAARAAPPDRRSTPTSSASSSCVEPVERTSTVDGRDIQGWFIPGRRRARRRPLGHRDPRRAAHALRLVAGAGSSRSSRRPGSASSTATRAARRATARTFNDGEPPRLGPGPDA